MRETQQRRLTAKGWTVGNAADFLWLSREEAAYVELRLRLAQGPQAPPAEARPDAIGRHAGDGVEPVSHREEGGRRPAVSLDLLIRALLSLGASRRDAAGIISWSSRITRASLT